LHRTTTHWTSVEDARRCGRQDAEAFALGLQENELRERQERVTRLAWGADVDPALAPAEPRDSSAIVLHLQHDVEQLASFYNAVLKSRAWILVQRIRRVFGREW
jgi:hypothetical protein